MYYSTVLVFSLVLAVCLSTSEVHGKYLNSNLSPYSGREDTVVDIGNGSHRTNTVVLTDDIGLGNRFGDTPTHSVSQPRPTQWHGTTVNNIGNGYGNSNTVVTRGRQPGVSHFNVGYGPNNNNKVFVDGRQIVPQPSATGAGRYPSTNTAQPRANAGQPTTRQITQVYVNGVPVTPDRTDASYSTYVAGGQTIHVRNTETRPTADNTAQVQNLYAISKQLQQVTTKLQQEAAKLNARI